MEAGERLTGHRARTRYLLRPATLVIAGGAAYYGAVPAMVLVGCVPKAYLAAAAVAFPGMALAAIAAFDYARRDDAPKPDGLRGRRLEPPGVFVKLRTGLVWFGLLGLAGAGVIAATGGPSAGTAALAGVVSFVLALVLSSRGYATGQVLLPDGPLRVGGPARLVFEFRRVGKGPPFERITFTLQCVVETPRLLRTWRPTVRRVFATTHEKGEDLPPGAFDVPLAFDVPAGLPATDFRATPAVYWELAVEGEGEGFRYDDRFLVAVHAASAQENVA